MKNNILLLLIIAIIEFHLCFNGFTNEPNWVKIWDNQGTELETIQEITRTETGWSWDVYVEGQHLFLGHIYPEI